MDILIQVILGPKGRDLMTIEYDKGKRMMNIQIKNRLMHSYMKLMFLTYLTLVGSCEFNSFSNYKIFISTGQTIYGHYFMLQHNFLVTPETNILEYLEELKPHYLSLYLNRGRWLWSR